MAAGRGRRASPLRSLLPRPCKSGHSGPGGRGGCAPGPVRGTVLTRSPPALPVAPRSPSPALYQASTHPAVWGFTETGLHSEGTPRPEQRGAGAHGGPGTPRGLLGAEQEATRRDPDPCFPRLWGR